MEYQVHFGKAYAMWLNGYDKDYHRIRTYKNKQEALKCLDDAIKIEPKKDNPKFKTELWEL